MSSTSCKYNTFSSWNVLDLNPEEDAFKAGMFWASLFTCYIYVKWDEEFSLRNFNE